MQHTNCNPDVTLPWSLQTESYLEELTDTVPEADMQTQTDAFLDRPATPLFVPAKMGVDATTQIEAADLFDFDFEVGCDCNMGGSQLAVSRLPGTWVAAQQHCLRPAIDFDFDSEMAATGSCSKIRPIC